MDGVIRCPRESITMPCTLKVPFTSMHVIPSHVETCDVFGVEMCLFCCVTNEGCSCHDSERKRDSNVYINIDGDHDVVAMGVSGWCH